MKLSVHIHQYVTPQVQLNIEFPRIKSKMYHTSQSVTSLVKINNVDSGFHLEEFGAQDSNLSLDISMQKDYPTDLLVTQV